MATRSMPELDAQYRALREGAGLLDRSERAKLTVRGDDAAEYLQGQLTNDIEALGPDQGCFGHVAIVGGRLDRPMEVSHGKL